MRYVCFLVAGFALFACSVERGFATDASRTFTVRQTEHGQQISQSKFETQGERLTIPVRSQTGIGSLELTRTGDGWPRKLVFRLHLRGLEMVELSSSTWTLKSGINSSSNVLTTEVQRADLKKVADCRIQKLQLDIVSLPGSAGYFVTVPVQILNENPKTMKLRWIDFFR